MNTNYRVVLNYFLFFLIISAVTLIQIFGVFRGLDNPTGMHHAQLARELARGNGLVTKSFSPNEWREHTTDKDQQKDFAYIEKYAGGKEELPELMEAPGGPLVMAGLFKLIGGGDFDSWKMPAEVYVYKLDRMVALLGSVLFIFALITNFFLIKRLFDQGIAVASVLVMVFCNLLWSFATSGMPQMLMLLFFSLAMWFWVSSREAGLALAQQEQEQEQDTGKKAKNPLPALIAACLCMSVVVLCNWHALWIYLGFVLMLGLFSRQRFAAVSIAVVSLFAVCGYWWWQNIQICGSPIGLSWQAYYQGLQGNLQSSMQSFKAGSFNFNARDILTRLGSGWLNQLHNFYSNAGSIVVIPLFIVALLHRFKSTILANLRWALLALWMFASIAATLAGVKDPYSNNQFYILFIPLMSAFGFAMLAILAARFGTQGSQKNLIGVVKWVAIALSAGPMLLDIPTQAKIGTFAAKTGIPEWPPYFPLGINKVLNSASAKNDLIISDQPWAVAWYADRRSMLMPDNLEDFNKMQNDYEGPSSGQIAGFLVSPCSFADKDLKTVKAQYGDFAPLIIDGSFFDFSDREHWCLDKSKKLGEISARYGGKNRVFLAGVEMIYYSK